jgi:thiosulfate dehydrogenase [quinone] large subunit
MEPSTTTEKDVDIMTTTTPRRPSTADLSTTAEPTTQRATRYVLAGLRLALGWVFLWAFLDKLFGLGRSTESAKSWLNGGSPTKGFLGNAVSGPFEGLYHSIAGAAWADVLFMAALLAVGTALLLGIGMRVAAIAGGLLLVMMWTAVLPPENNPFMDDHLVYAGVLALLALTAAGNTLGLGRQWAQLPIVERLPWLR